MAKDLSDYYAIHTPTDVPLGFCSDGYYRLAAKAECRKCGQSFVQIIRCHRYRDESPVSITQMTKKPDPNDAQVMTSFMVKACNNGVGNPKVHMRGCSIGSIPRTGKFALTGLRPNQFRANA